MHMLYFCPFLPVGKHTIEFSVTDHIAGPDSELIKKRRKLYCIRKIRPVQFAKYHRERLGHCPW